MLITAVFPMSLAEMLNKMCLAQGEWTGQPNNMGLGQNRCTWHQLQLSWNVKTGLWRRWKCVERQVQMDKWAPSFLCHGEEQPSPRYRLQEQCWDLILLWPPLVPPFLRLCSLWQNLNTAKKKLEARQHQNNIKSLLLLCPALESFTPNFWRAASDLLMPCAKCLCAENTSAQQFSSNTFQQPSLAPYEDLPRGPMGCKRNFCNMVSHGFFILVIRFHFVIEEAFLNACWRVTTKIQYCRNNAFVKDFMSISNGDIKPEILWHDWFPKFILRSKHENVFLYSGYSKANFNHSKTGECTVKYWFTAPKRNDMQNDFL